MGSYIQGHDSEMEVVGTGRLQFYSAPSTACSLPGRFILPKESVDAYTEYDRFTYVVYNNLKTGSQVSGWVKSFRLRFTGSGNGPS